jgi:predicted amino acid-binding ACT domain protein
MRKFNFDTIIIEVIKGLYSEATSAVFLNNEIGQFFKTTAGIRQRCILSPVLFNIYLENIMQKTLNNFQTSVSITGTEAKFQELTTKLKNVIKKFGLEINIDKSMILVNSQ